jgi:hypothetical protein
LTNPNKKSKLHRNLKYFSLGSKYFYQKFIDQNKFLGKTAIVSLIFHSRVDLVKSKLTRLNNFSRLRYESYMCTVQSEALRGTNNGVHQNSHAFKLWI